VRAAHPEAQVEVWAADEHRVGLKPIVRRLWARRGQRPLVRVQHRYQWLYLLAFVHPVSGRSEWSFASTVTIDVMSVALAAFARAVGAGPTKHIVLVLDQAGYHTSPLVAVPEGIHLVFLPPYSPELQPAEHLWQFSDAPLANKHFPTLAALEDTLARRCDALQRQRQLIHSATYFHWWPAQ
jgi:DDE superfamily endonuclease